MVPLCVVHQIRWEHLPKSIWLAICWPMNLLRQGSWVEFWAPPTRYPSPCIQLALTNNLVSRSCITRVFMWTNCVNAECNVICNRSVRCLTFPRPSTKVWYIKITMQLQSCNNETSDCKWEANYGSQVNVRTIATAWLKIGWEDCLVWMQSQLSWSKSSIASLCDMRTCHLVDLLCWNEIR